MNRFNGLYDIQLEQATFTKSRENSMTLEIDTNVVHVAQYDF